MFCLLSILEQLLEIVKLKVYFVYWKICLFCVENLYISQCSVLICADFFLQGVYFNDRLDKEYYVNRVEEVRFQIRGIRSRIRRTDNGNEVFLEFERKY